MDLSCNLLPVIIHGNDEKDKRLVLPLASYLDDLKHDASKVYEVQKTVTAFLKKNHLHIKEIHYFSDGCATQYKNKCNFIILCPHENFQPKAQWSCFATSHGNTKYNGI